ncbi:flagellar basal body-associated FliL family protein [Aeromonas cavernicola]|uniref:Flagellar protein FliL n=1 Tax=Aeromonas cavernicola TaxID=1006623 RepID=A0A2H9U8U3_9GAMM|nr:flagellar basal body-associated FliL family protein [Aeromonas cavernicola]PJG60431.1 flagellar basal body-associated protein FliL [Aeromonas cavernicola]
MKIFKIFLLLLLSCGGWQVQASSEEEPAVEGAEGVVKPSFSYHALDPDIITNYLSNNKTLGYLRVSVELMAENEADLKLLEQHDPLIRDAIIRLIGSKQGEQVKSLVNREELRQECEAKVNELLVSETGKKAVRELFFTKFLYQ